MLWTIFEILAYMIAAAVLGVVLGWILRGAFGSEQKEVESLRVQLRKMKRAQREARRAQSAAEKASSAPVTSSATDTKGSKAKADAKPTAKPKSDTPKKDAAPKAAKEAPKKPKAAPAKSKAKPSKAERDASQATAKKAVVGIIERVGKSESKDDLTKIYGVGPKFSSLLNEMEITSYQQVAKFTKADIRTVSSALGSFSDRIERDDWVAGAKKVMQEQKK